MCVLFTSEGEGLGMRLALSLVQKFTVHACLHYNDYIAEGKSLVILYKYMHVYSMRDLSPCNVVLCHRHSSRQRPE